MDKQMKDIFCRQIDTELERISKLPSLDNNSLNQLHMLTDTKKNLLKIEKLEMENEGMMSGNSFRMMGNSYAQNNGNGYSMNGPYYGYGGSYDNGYSRTDGRSHLEAAMRDARSEQEREEIRQLMSRYHN